MIRKALYVARLGKPTVHRELIDGKATDYGVLVPTARR